MTEENCDRELCNHCCNLVLVILLHVFVYVSMHIHVCHNMYGRQRTTKGSPFFHMGHWVRWRILAASSFSSCAILPTTCLNCKSQILKKQRQLLSQSNLYEFKNDPSNVCMVSLKTIAFLRVMEILTAQPLLQSPLNNSALKK